MPLYRNLCHRDGQLHSQKQEFYVEYPGRETLRRENLLRRRAGEQFEAALGVTDMADTKNPENSVETVHKDIAED